MSTRRNLLLGSAALAALSKLPAKAAPATKNIYRNIGVRPVINARGTFTIITGSQSLPEVKKAMEEASNAYVNMDELMEGVSPRLAAATGAEWGIVTNGCCAAIAHTTAAAIAGTNPERMQRLPDLTGLKNEVIIPEYSRNVYDHAVRMTGAKIIEVTDPARLDETFTPRTALIYILAGPGDEGPLGTAILCAAAKRHNVPVLVDAAAEGLTFPNVHLARGATVVAYSGGKCIRGPQAAGLLIGDKNLCQAAWLNSAPHHAYGRALKVGKEEIMGMLAAAEAWKTRDHDAEWNQWLSWLDHIGKRVTAINGVTTSIIQPVGLSNRTPSLRILWDADRLGITGTETAKLLLDTEPRIVVAGGTGTRPNNMPSTVTITPWMMMPGDDKIVADRLVAVLSKPPKFDNPVIPQGTPATVEGQWDAQITFARGTAHHTLILEQSQTTVVGTHRGEYMEGDLAGTVAATEVRLRSSQKMEGTRLTWDFVGRISGDTMEGSVNMGEYGEATWSAKRHQYLAPGGIVRPIKTV